MDCRVDTYPLELERQWFAAHGYVVLAVNYRGSSGRGSAFASAIVADWGDKEVADLLGAVDYAVREKIADPHRLGVGGWSYGGILTDYLIASDTRFKAAIAGAGSGNQLSTYGSDEYVMQYNAELGPPWASTDRWLKVSYPFFHAGRIKTPTLFLGGDKDFNVPVAGGEQMYEALRTLGVPTELIIYPGPVSPAHPAELYQGPYPALSRLVRSIPSRTAELRHRAGPVRALRIGSQNPTQAARSRAQLWQCNARNVIHHRPVLVLIPDP